MSFPRYPKYKDSGVEWLGEVPEHWETCSLKRIVRMQSGESITAERIEEVGDYPVFGGNGLRGFTSAFTHDGHYVLVGRQGALCGNVNYTEGKFWASEHAVVVSPVKQVETVWLGEMLRSMNLNQHSVSAAQPGLSVDQLTRLLTVVPPLAEQTGIAAFLDREAGKIDDLVAEQQRLMELLKEKRQAVISHAVTKGLNPRAPMKPSGIEWLGDVPEHWRVMPLGRISISRCDGPFGSGLKSEHYAESGVRVIRLQNIRHDGFDGTDEAFVDHGYYNRELVGHEVVAGDVLIAGLGDDNNTVGRACVAPSGLEPAMVKADCFRFRLDLLGALPEFVAMALNVGATADAGILASGSTRVRIPLSTMATRKLPIPPLGEQRAIARFARDASQYLDALAAESQKAIDLLQERRTALISAAVAGQIDVRKLAAA
jgi:type I restriction enzyme S subunit